MTALNEAIETLLAACRAEPGYPFADWTTNHQSFFRLINFWDQVFQLAASDKAGEYRAAQEIFQNASSPIYFVKNANESKKICIWAGLTGQAQADVAFFWGRYPDLDKPDPGGESYSQSLSGKYKLEISCDFDPDRVLASAQMIRAFTHTDTSTADAQHLLESDFEDRFRSYFPIPEPDFGDDD